MVCKFFGTKKGGGNSAVDYLLNERVEQGTAEVIRGNEATTREIISNIKFKHKTTVGVLSFEERDITQRQKQELMDSLEDTLFQGLDKNDYNILWVEHRDKGRLELNFVIPKIHLGTQKQLQPYYHKQHLPLLEKWQKMINLKYGYTDPQDPSKKRAYKSNFKDISLAQDYKQLDVMIKESVTNFQFGSRTELVEMLNKSGINARESKNYISVRLPSQKKAKRFKGGIYEQWNSFEQLTEKLRETERAIKSYNERDTKGELERYEREYRAYLSENGRYNTQRYQSKPKRNTERAKRTDTRDRTTKSNDLSSMDSNRANNTSNNIHKPREDEYINSEVGNDYIGQRGTVTDREQRIKETNTTKRRDIQGQRGNVYQVHSDNIQRQEEREHEIYPSGELLDDTIRETINTSIADSREKEQSLIRELTRTRERVHEQYINSSEEVRAKYRGNAKRVDSNAKEYQQQRDRRVQELKTIARDNTISAHANSGTISTVAERFKQSVGTFIERVQERAREMYQSVSQGFGLSR
jgi:hypothetical protein